MTTNKKAKKEPGLIVLFDEKEYTQEETAFLWTRLTQILMQLQKI